jgi:hypothetical protein
LINITNVIREIETYPDTVKGKAYFLLSDAVSMPGSKKFKMEAGNACGPVRAF